MNFFKGSLRKKKKAMSLPVTTSVDTTRPIDHAFRDYIHNEIPNRFLDTSSRQFILRKDVFDIFRDQIANVTEDTIQDRIRHFQADPFATYQPRRETVLRQIIQETVKYGILSHHWGEEADEPTFQDVSDRKLNGNGPKFAKVDGFCKTAGNLGNKLAWVDTCCIDEMNPAERSEAIHGMYKWYANAFYCIAYLAESTSYESWDTDSWFTRGWTLQELLAPKRLKFYGHDWRPLAPPHIEDDRKYDEVRPRLESITGIPQAVFMADNSLGIDGCSFWQIMSWASKRQTTRVEDRAYCLIGLFRVTLNVAYGEGQRAFFRLLQTIIANHHSWDVLAWLGQPSQDHFALPPSPASYPQFEADMVLDREGVQEVSISAYQLSFKSLPLISMQLRSVEQSKGSERPYYIVYLEQRKDVESSLAKFGDLVVHCGTTRLQAIQEAGLLSACIINHHGARHREKGKLVIRQEYICFLLYKKDTEDEGGTWVKLATNNLLRMTCLGGIETVASGSASGEPASDVESGKFVSESPLVTTILRSPRPPSLNMA